MKFTKYGTKEYYEEQVRNTKAIIAVLKAGIQEFARTATGSPADENNRIVFDATFYEIDAKERYLAENEEELRAING